MPIFYRMKNIFRFLMMTLSLCALSAALTGCFETEFRFHTKVSEDGSVERNTSFDGRGAHMFKAPAGPGWQSKEWETKGEAALLPDAIYHVEAQGKFKAGQLISSDYAFNLEKSMANWDAEAMKELAEAGIQEPYEQNLSSRNEVKVSRIKGLLTETVFYEERFQNTGLIQLLLSDLKDEIKRQGEARKETLEDLELEILARLRLEEEILPEIRFKHELEMPGKINASNGNISGNRVKWEFSLRDFNEDYSVYQMTASSRALRLPGLIAIATAGILALLALLAAVTGVFRIKSAGRKKQRPS